MGIQIQNAIFLGSAKPGSGSGGGNVDYTKVVSKTKTMPTASADNLNIIYMYEGETDANYTHGYVYENHKTATYTGTVSFDAATLSGTTVACSGDNFANFLTESGVSPLSVVSGTMTYDAAGSLWILVGKNASDETVLSFQEYQEDYENFGFTFTGTPQDGDVVSFTCSVEEDVVSYAWVRFNVQPGEIPNQTGQNGKFLTTNGSALSWGTAGGLPTQTGNAGKFLTTDGTDAGWSTTVSDTFYVQNLTSNQTIDFLAGNGRQYVFFHPIKTNLNRSASVSVDYDSSHGQFNFRFERSSVLGYHDGVTIGAENNIIDLMFVSGFASSYARNIITVPNVAGTMVVATPPSADGTYVLKATVADGVVTYTWVAE